MAKGFNKVILMGNLTRDPELRSTSGGQSVCSFSIAVNRTWTNQAGERQDAVDFFDCVAWGKLGETIERYLNKGRPVLVSGRLSTSSWEQEGQKRSKVEITVEDFNFIGGGDSDGGSNYSASSSSSSDASSSDDSQSGSSSKVEIDDSPVDLSDIPF